MNPLDLAAVEAASALFEQWATMRTNWELDVAIHGTSTFPVDSVARLNGLLPSFVERAKPLIAWAESYGIDAEPLRVICFSIQGGEDAQRRATVRAVLSRLSGAIIRGQRGDEAVDDSGDVDGKQTGLRASAGVQDNGERVGEPVTSTAPMSVTDLAAMHHLDPEKLRKRLQRERAKNLECYIEMDDVERKSRDPKYLYKPAKVKPIIDAMKHLKTSGERPAK